MHQRILAIDLRSQLFGFAVLEGAHTLLGFGRRRLRIAINRDGAAVVREKVDRLITFFGPSVIILKHTSGREDRELLGRKDAIAVIADEAKTRSVKLVILKRRDISQAFRQFGKTSKFKIAGLIAEMFPEVAWKLPPRRKNWEPEHHNMPIFDAIAIGLTYLANSENIVPPFQARKN